MLKTRGRKPKPPIGGLDSAWLLAVKSRPGITWRYSSEPTPTHFLIDRVRFPGNSTGMTTIPAHARRWNESSGPRQFLLRHPALKRNYKPFKILGAMEMAPAGKKK